MPQGVRVQIPFWAPKTYTSSKQGHLSPCFCRFLANHFMKLISLNTWGGRAGKEELLAFFERHRDIDIFCLQEIWSAPYNDMDRAAG